MLAGKSVEAKFKFGTSRWRVSVSLGRRAELPFPQKLSALLPKWFTITDDLYATQAAAEVKEDEVMPNKRPKWKIRGDYRGSGARIFDRNSSQADAWVAYLWPDDKTRTSSFKFRPSAFKSQLFKKF